MVAYWRLKNNSAKSGRASLTRETYHTFIKLNIWIVLHSVKELRHDILSRFLRLAENNLHREGNHKILVW